MYELSCFVLLWQSYLMWVDLFALFQILILTFAVFETWAMHRIGRRNPDLSDFIDHAMLFTFPAGYLIMLLTMLLWANEQTMFAIVFMSISLVAIAGMNILWVLLRMKQRGERIRKILHLLRRLDLNNSRTQAAFKDAFRYYDTNHDGEMVSYG